MATGNSLSENAGRMTDVVPVDHQRKTAKWLGLSILKRLLLRAVR